jgi:hypothetical protein
MHFLHTDWFMGSSYTIVHHVDGVTFGGPMDEHSKINLNRPDDRGLLLVFDDVTLDIVDALGDWIDEDDNISSLGVERDYYLALEAPYAPRNGPLRTLGEFELVAGVWPKYFRAEDWNLNNRLDANEDDGARSFPPDEPDGILDSAWSGQLTVYSVGAGATASGLPRLLLKRADPEELEERLSVTAAQAEAIKNYGSSDTNVLTDLLFTPLAGTTGRPGGGDEEGGTGNPATSDQPGSSGRSGSAQQAQGVPALNDKQLTALFAEASIEDPVDRLPGKMNLNTIPSQLLRDIFTLMSMDEAIADEIIFMRSSRPQGIVSLVELQKIPNITTTDLRAITRRFDVVSNVFTITSRGRSETTGLEVEIIAVVDRSTVPVRILEYREQ